MLREVKRVQMGTLEEDLSMCAVARWGAVGGGGQVGTGGRCKGVGRERCDKECCNWTQIMTTLSSVRILRQKDMERTGQGQVPTVWSLSPRFGS